MLVTPIHDKFVTWFTLAFSLQTLTLVCCCFTMYTRKVCNAKTAQDLDIIIRGGLVIALLSIYIIGMVWRFSQSGQYAAGDLTGGEALYSDDSIELVQW